ncbi:rhodanese-like domain-containing protein [Ginsengibacter hankyongi]|uniref:Rhodanese-like domain-containing protein n=1 Tax=Ginsengibacter hankyongi TaxID=2607284 RepID=A0A5J5IRJ4_9BACT|nr:rhodanese-like domain-containing protein [Ginsengibacter hankyongi]KAA9042182.1 rhodanese-like domain-containing protein [Ginsengibacter hankyongi]
MYLKQINADINPEGSGSLSPLNVNDFKSKMAGDSLVLDTRSAAEFSNGFIPGSIFIGLEGRFAEWARSILSYHLPIILVTDFGKEEETVIRLASSGFTKVEGYLSGGFESWKQAGEKIDIIIDIEADEFAMDIPFDDNLIIVDVREENEFNEGHVKDAINLPLTDMTDIAQIAQLEETQNIYLHSASGYRSLIAASVLKKQGYHNIRNVVGGWVKIKEQNAIKTEKEARILN